MGGDCLPSSLLQVWRTKAVSHPLASMSATSGENNWYNAFRLWLDLTCTTTQFSGHDTHEFQAAETAPKANRNQILFGRLKFRYHGAFVGATMRIDYYRGLSVVWATHSSFYGARIYWRRLQKDFANINPTFTASSCLEPRLLS